MEVKAGIQGPNVTVNGMGERAGNAPLESTVAVINDFFSTNRNWRKRIFIIFCE
jgi:isopropylmalate/homocitrate/citramalate synthase